jgi:hypothetical protein
MYHFDQTGALKDGHLIHFYLATKLRTYGLICFVKLPALQCFP